MADVKKVVEIEIDVESGEVKQLNQEIKQINKSTKSAQKGTTGLAGSWKKVGTALKAAGIGLLIAALAKLTEFLGRNQKIADGFTTAMNALSMAFNDFFNFIGDNIGTVTDYFRDLFDNPLEKIQEIGRAIGDYLMAQVNLAIEGIGKLGESIAFLLDAEFAKAAEAAGDGALKLGEAFVKLNPATAVMANLAETVYENRDAIVDYAQSTIEAASNLTELNKAAELAEVRQQGLIEKYDRQAEIQRQIRDDFNLSFEERIAANEELGRILEEQGNAEKELLETRKNALQQNFDAGLIAQQEYLLEYERLKNEEAAVDARIEGFRSEQLVNENALREEKRQAEQEDLDRLNEQLKFERDTRLGLMEEGQEKEIAQSKAKYLALYEQAIGNRELQLEILEAQKEEEAAIVKKYEDEKIAVEKAAQEQRLDLVQGGLQAVADLTNAFAGQSEKAQKRAFQINKALQIAQATIQTYQSATAAYASQLTIPTPDAPVRAAVAAGVAVAFGLAQVASIARTKFKGGGVGSVAKPSTAGIGGGESPNSPQFNTVGASGTNQLAESIANQNQTPSRAYVVASDISTAQALDRNKIDTASFG